MKLKNNYIRILAEILISVIVALVIEVSLNYSAFVAGYEPMQLSQAKKDEKLIFTKTFDEPVYVKKLVIQGNFEKKIPYTIEINKINSLGTKEKVTISDKANFEMNLAVTAINETVSKIRVVFEDSEQISVQNAYLENRIHFNKYRMVFFTLIILSVLLLFLEKKAVMQRLELFYLLVALGMGGLLVWAAGPQAITWDEEVHYKEAYIQSYDSNVVWSQAALKNSERISAEVNSNEEKILLENYMNELANDGESTISDKEGVHARAKFIYSPMSLMLKIGRILPLSYTQQYMLGRIGNLVCCVLINCIGIYFADKKKILFTAIALMPTVIFQGSMYTYDGIIFSCMSLGTILIYHFIEKKKNCIKIWNIVLPLFLFITGIMAKPVYIPFLLLLLPLVRYRLRSCSEKQKKIFRITVSVLGIGFLAVVVCYLVPFMTNILSGNITLPGDSRGGETDAAAQLAVILRNPVGFMKMLAHEMFTLDNFRNFGDESLNHFMASNLMFLNLYVLGMLKDAWSYILLPLLGLLFFVSPEEESCPRLRGMKLYSGIVIVGAAVLVWLAMYLFFTPVGMAEIEGVQARYFLPLIMPVAYFLWNDKLKIKLSKEKYMQLVMSTVLMLIGVCMYQSIIVGKVG